MRFLKVFLISFSSLVGVIGIALGGMFLSGSFSKETILPEAISFGQSSYEVTEDFEMTISTQTDEVSETEVTLSFNSQTENQGYITDGIITVPKYVRIGIPFTVKLNIENKNINGELLPWIKGGISTLKATSKNVSARIESTSIYVDVPVHSLTLSAKTTLSSQTQNDFNIGENFWIEANFLPAESAYKFSKNGTDGNAAVMKTVFFSSLSNSISEISITQNSNSKQYNASQRADGVVVEGYAFSSAKEELLAFEREVGNSEELRYSNILNYLSNVDISQRVIGSAVVNFKQLVVGSFNVDNILVPSKFNNPIRLFAANQTLGQDQYNLDIQILANNQATVLPNEIRNVGVALAVDDIDDINGYPKPATQNQFNISGSSSIIHQFFGKDFTFFFPFVNQIDVQKSYWDITALTENLNATLIVVLFKDTENGRQVSEFSVESGNPKFLLNMDSTNVVSNQVQWSNPSQTTTILYIYDNDDSSQKVYQQFNLKNLNYIIPTENTYKTVLYFAYLEEIGGGVPSVNYDISDYINVGSRAIVYQDSPDPLSAREFYEIPNGVLTPKDTAELPSDIVIKVVFATVKTGFNGPFMYDDEGHYIVDRFSSNSQLGTLQPITFKIEKTLKTLNAHLKFNSDTAFFDEPNSTLALVQGTANAFEIVFDITSPDQKQIFVRDWNAGKININFNLLGGYTDTLFSFDRETFVYDDNTTYSIFVNVSYLSYITADPGYRQYTVSVSYQRGTEPITHKQINQTEYFDAELVDSLNSTTNMLEIYDGKIAEIKFEEDLSALTEENPLIVRTSLTKEFDGPEAGVYFAAQDSTFAFIHNGATYPKGNLIDDQTKTFKIVAKDKYGKIIEDKTLWTLATNDDQGQSLTVSSSGQSLNFVGNSSNPIEVYITSSNGIGGKSVISNQKIYVNVETNGQIAYVATNPTGVSGQNVFVWDNINRTSFNSNLQTFNLNDVENKFNDNTINISITGEKNKVVNLANTSSGIINILKMYYALPSVAEGALVNDFEIFDLLKITNFIREDAIEFGDFIVFNEGLSVEDSFIRHFTIKKDFGQTVYLNLQAQTEIGVNVSLRIEIKPSINAVLNSYDHEDEFAQGGYFNAVRYSGVYANSEIRLEFQNFSIPVAVAGINPLVFDYDTNQIIAIKGQTIDNNIVIIESSSSITIIIYLPDVIGITYKRLGFVLASSSVDYSLPYEKTGFDFSADIYLRVNPNITTIINPSFESQNNEITIYASSLTLAELLTLGTNPNPNNMIVVSRLKTSQNTTPLALNANLLARMSNVSGAPIDNSEFFNITRIDNSNTLILKKEFSESQSLYVSVYHYASGSNYFMVSTYRIIVKPDIVQKEESADNFIHYNSKDYLQLVSGQTYTFDELAQNFEVSKIPSSSLFASFDSNYVSQTAYWIITSDNRIQIKASLPQIVPDVLWVNIRLQGVVTTRYPIILMPKQSPLVQYNEEHYIDENLENPLSSTNIERNAEANKDLYDLLALSYLVDNDIYDAIYDSTYDVKASYNSQTSEGRKYGIYIGENDIVLYSLRDGNGGFSGVDFAQISAQGILTLNFVGADAYVVVVATVNGLNIYYRVKVMATLSLEAFYPYEDNINGTNLAEYIINRPTDTSREIVFSNNFTDAIPAHIQILPNTFKTVYDEDLQQNIYVPVNITNRIMMFRDTIIDNSPARLLMNYSIKSVDIKSITTLSGTVITGANRSNYAVVNRNELLNITNVIIKNNGSYTLILSIETTDHAYVEYKFVVEYDTRTYTVVSQITNETISNMPAFNSSITILSPENPDERTFSNELLNKHLKMTKGVQTTNVTSLLKFFVVNNVDLDEQTKAFSIEDNVIYANYSVNTIYSSLMFYTKYGEVLTVPLVLESLIKVFDVDTNSITTGKSVYAGSVFDFDEQVKFIENQTEITPDRIEWISVDFVGQMPNYIVRDSQELNKFIIKPVKQGTNAYTLRVVVEITTGETAQEFKFDYTLTVDAGVVSNKPTMDNLIPLNHQYVSNFEDILLNIFATNANTLPSLFTYSGLAEVTFTANNNVITGSIADYSSSLYTLVVVPITGGSVIKSTRMIDLDTKALVLQTNAVEVNTEVVLRVQLKIDANSSNDIVSYISFVVKPDSEVNFNYPTPSAQELDFESVYVNDPFTNYNGNVADTSGFSLKYPSKFQTKSRVQVLIPQTTTPVSSQNYDVYVVYKKVDGDLNLVVNGGEFYEGQFKDMSAQTPYQYDYFDSFFTFAFPAQSAYTFAVVDFEIFVNGISRGIYTLKVYKDISSVYQVQINYINQIESNSEVFYVGEDRVDIFNGVQALQFKVNTATNILTSQTNIKVYRTGTPLVLLTSFNLSSSDRGATKTIKLYTELNAIPTSELRFVLNDDGVYRTLQQVSVGTSTPSHAIFNIDAETGSNSFKLLKRLLVTYLGYEIDESLLLGEVQVRETSLQSGDNELSQFKLNYQNINSNGDPDYNNEVAVYFGSDQGSGDSTLGYYYYTIKVNIMFEHGDELHQIMAGEEIVRVLDVFGIQKQTGEKFVTYSGNSPVFGANNPLQNISLEFDLVFGTDDGTVTGNRYVYADTRLPYNHLSNIEPIRVAANRITNSNNVFFTYNFSLLASGAPNSSIIAFIDFKYSYNDVYSNQRLNFVKRIEIQINPNWEFSMLNYNGEENSASNPQIINEQNFQGLSTKRYSFVDTQNAGLTQVFAYMVNNYQAGNQAINFKYEVVFGNAEIDNIIQSSVVTNKGVILSKPSFAEQEVRVKIVDEYLYEKTFFFKIIPDYPITFVQMTERNNVYEGNTFSVYYSTGSFEGVDHRINLSEQNFDDQAVGVTYRLMRSDNNTVIQNGITHDGSLSTSGKINYLNGELFTSQTLPVYIELTLISGNEEYTIRTDSFLLRQRYSASIGETKTNDGKEINLIDYIEVLDYKFNNSLYIGSPVLSNEKTLVISNPSFHGDIKVMAYSATEQQFSTDITVLASNKFFMLSNYFNQTVMASASYKFLVTSIRDDSMNSLEISTVAVSGQLSVVDSIPGNSTYIVHLFNGTQYKDVLVTEGTPQIIGSGWGIIGYELSSNGFMMDVVYDTVYTFRTNKLWLSNNNFNVVLQSYNASGILVDTMNIESLSGSTNQIIINKNYASPVTMSSAVGGYYYANITAPSSGGLSWQITSYSGIDQRKFEVKADKKLSIITINTNNNESVDIKLNGSYVVNIALNYNGMQTVSLMQYLENNYSLSWKSFVASSYALASTPISTTDLQKIKGMEYYDDTVYITLSATDRDYVSLGVRLFRLRNGVTTIKNIEVPLKLYAYTFTLGLSNLFEDPIMVGDVYSFTVSSMPTVSLTSIKITWPNANTTGTILGTTQNDYLSNNPSVYTLRYGTYTVDMQDNMIVEGKQTISLDSKLFYDTVQNGKFVNVKRYYIVKFADAYYTLDAFNFQVAPYYYGINFGASQERNITDYSQISGEQISYLINFATWAKNINLLAANGSILPDTLVSDSQKTSPLLKYTINTGYSGAGNGELIAGNDLKVTGVQDLSSQYFIIDVNVALNGDPSTNMWLYIGSIRLGFSQYNQFLEPDQYVIASESTVQVGGEDVTEIHLRYIDIDETAKVTFSINSIFEGENVTYENNIRTMVTDLSKVYLSSQHPAYYQIDYNFYETNALKLNTILESSYINKVGDKIRPIVIGKNLINGQGFSFSIVIDGVEHTANYTNQTGQTIYGEVNLNNINITYNTVSYTVANLLDFLDDEEIEYSISSGEKVDVLWTEIDLTQLKDIAEINFYGDGTDSTNGMVTDLISGLNIYASKMFKLTKLNYTYVEGVIPDVTSVNIKVAERVSTTQSRIEYYAVTQLIQDINGFTTHAQTYVYELENDTALSKNISLDLFEFDSNYSAFSAIGSYSRVVIIEKLTVGQGITGPTIINPNGYYSYNVVDLQVKDSDNSTSYVSNTEIIAQTSNLGIYKQNLYDYMLMDFNRIVTQNNIGGSSYTIYAGIYTSKLTATENSVNIDIIPDTDNNEVVNIITRQAVVGEDEQVVYTYEYVGQDRTSLPIQNNQVKIILKSNAVATGTLIWHEMQEQVLPLEVIYFSRFIGGNWVAQTPAANITGLQDGYIVGELWNGTMTIASGYQENDILQFSYDTDEVYFVFGEYRINESNVIKLGELLSGGLRKSLVGEVSLMTKTLKDFIEEEADNAFILRYSGVTYGIVYYDATTEDLSLFDLIVDENNNRFTKLLKSNITIQGPVTNYGLQLGWTVPQLGYYAFKQGDNVVYVNVIGTATYDLFNIFNTKTILLSDGEISVNRLVEGQIVLGRTIINPQQENANIKFVGEDAEYTINDIPVVFSDNYYNIVFNIQAYWSTISLWNETQFTVFEVDDNGEVVLYNPWQKIDSGEMNGSQISLIQSTVIYNLSSIAL